MGHSSYCFCFSRSKGATYIQDEVEVATEWRARGVAGSCWGRGISRHPQIQGLLDSTFSEYVFQLVTRNITWY